MHKNSWEIWSCVFLMKLHERGSFHCSPEAFGPVSAVCLYCLVSHQLLDITSMFSLSKVYRLTFYLVWKQSQHQVCGSSEPVWAISSLWTSLFFVPFVVGRLSLKPQEEDRRLTHMELTVRLCHTWINKSKSKSSDIKCREEKSITVYWVATSAVTKSYCFY